MAYRIEELDTRNQTDSRTRDAAVFILKHVTHRNEAEYDPETDEGRIARYLAETDHLFALTDDAQRLIGALALEHQRVSVGQLSRTLAWSPIREGRDVVLFSCDTQR